MSDEGQITRQAVEYIRFVLETLEITPRQLALQAGLAPSTITRPLTDPNYRFTISTKTLGKIRDFSKIDPTPFLKVDAHGTARAAAVLTAPDEYFVESPEGSPRDNLGLLERTMLILGAVGYDLWRPIPKSTSRLGMRPRFLPFASWDPNHFAFSVSDDHCDHIAAAQYELVVCRQAPEQKHPRDPDFGRGRPVVVQRINQEREELTVQRLYADDAGRLILQFASNNPSMPAEPRFYDPKRELIIAHVDWVFRDVKQADQLGWTPEARASNLQQSLQEREARLQQELAERSAKIAELGGYEQYQAWRKEQRDTRIREAEEQSRRRKRYMKRVDKITANLQDREKKQK